MASRGSIRLARHARAPATRHVPVAGARQPLQRRAASAALSTGAGAKAGGSGGCAQQDAAPRREQRQEQQDAGPDFGVSVDLQRLGLRPDAGRSEPPRTPSHEARRASTTLARRPWPLHAGLAGQRLHTQHAARAPRGRRPPPCRLAEDAGDAGARCKTTPRHPRMRTRVRACRASSHACRRPPVRCHRGLRPTLPAAKAMAWYSASVVVGTIACRAAHSTALARRSLWGLQRVQLLPGCRPGRGPGAGLCPGG